MNKRIAVYLGESTGEIQEHISKSLVKYANALGYDVIIFCTYGSYNDDFLYAEGEKSVINLPDFSMFDGVILTEDVFNIEGMADELYKLLRKNATCPIVYMRTKRKGCYSVLTENQVSMEEMTRHFTKHHGFRDICFMSGKKTSLDAAERLQGFCNVMEEEGIPVTEHMIFHGDYWRDKGKEAIDWFMEGRDHYPQAIICANDYMAISIIDELKKRDIRVPEDVCVSGVDHISEGYYNHPSITSLGVDFDKMSEDAISIIDKANNGVKSKSVTTVPSKIMLHKSCGCGEQFNAFRTVSRAVDEPETIQSMKHLMISATEYQDAWTEEECLRVTEKYAEMFNSECTYFCMCDMDEEGFSKVENDNLFSKNMFLKRIFYGSESAEKCNLSFKRKDILPKQFWKKNQCNSFIVFSVHFKNRVFGYIVAEYSESKWVDIFTQGYIMNLGNAIQNIVMQKKLANLEEIRSLYQKDELTGLYNRRGFDIVLRERWDMGAVKKGKYYLVSLDMDGLKYINDTFGHLEGDKALIYIAQALQSVMREGEFCARNGGDEFGALIFGNEKRFAQFEKEFKAAIDKVNQLGLEYPVEASYGCCVFHDEPDDTVINCVSKADMRMYENKKLRKEQGITIR